MPEPTPSINPSGLLALAMICATIVAVVWVIWR